MLLNKSTIMTTTITNPTKCAWCNCWMHRGEKCWTLKAGKFNDHIHKLLNSICNKHTDKICPGLKSHMLSFIITPPNWKFQAYCTDCGLFDIKFSRSGRTIKAPMRLQDESFVSGSGFSGCDHYDHGYDNGLVTDRKRDWCFQDDMLARFLVEDDVVEEDSSPKQCKEEIVDSEKDEWSDFSSDEEEEEFDSDRDWD